MSRTYPFFATDAEVAGLWNWISSILGVLLLESDSRPDMPLRKFECFPLEEWADPEHRPSLVAWPSSCSALPVEQEIKFNDEGQRWTGETGRTSLSCPAFIRIFRVHPPSSEFLGFNELVFETPATAKAMFTEAQIACVDWPRLSKQIGEIKRHIQKSAAGKWRSIPVSNGVADILREDDKRLWFWGHEGTL